MEKSKSYLVAFLVCLIEFIIITILSALIGLGVFLKLLLFGLIFATWRGIVGAGKSNKLDDEELATTQQNSTEIQNEEFHDATCGEVIVDANIQKTKDQFLNVDTSVKGIEEVIPIIKEDKKNHHDSLAKEFRKIGNGLHLETYKLVIIGLCIWTFIHTFIFFKICWKRPFHNLL